MNHFNKNSTRLRTSLNGIRQGEMIAFKKATPIDIFRVSPTHCTWMHSVHFGCISFAARANHIQRAQRIIDNFWCWHFSQHERETVFPRSQSRFFGCAWTISLYPRSVKHSSNNLFKPHDWRLCTELRQLSLFGLCSICIVLNRSNGHFLFNHTNIIRGDYTPRICGSSFWFWWIDWFVYSRVLFYSIKLN